jgi:hypothetical protein
MAGRPHFGCFAPDGPQHTEADSSFDMHVISRGFKVDHCCRITAVVAWQVAILGILLCISGGGRLLQLAAHDAVLPAASLCRPSPQRAALPGDHMLLLETLQPLTSDVVLIAMPIARDHDWTVEQRHHLQPSSCRTCSNSRPAGKSPAEYTVCSHTRTRAAGSGCVADLLHCNSALPGTLCPAALRLLAAGLVLQRCVLAAVRLPDPGECMPKACRHWMCHASWILVSTVDCLC